RQRGEGLARAALPHHRGALARPHLEADVVDEAHHVVAAVQVEGEVVDAEQRLRGLLGGGGDGLGEVRRHRSAYSLSACRLLRSPSAMALKVQQARVITRPCQKISHAVWLITAKPRPSRLPSLDAAGCTERPRKLSAPSASRARLIVARHCTITGPAM